MPPRAAGTAGKKTAQAAERRTAKAPPEIVRRALFLLAPLGPVRARAMFGGYGLYLDDLMFALIAWNRLYLKVDGESKGRFAKAGGEPFVYQGRSKPIEMSYWTLPERFLGDPGTLAPWAERALSAARRARATKAGKVVTAGRRALPRTRSFSG